MKKMCFVTATRSEYGLMKWLMKEVDESSEYELQVIATGAHLMAEQGHTVDAIREDGFVIDKEVDIGLDTSSQELIADSMGRMSQKLSHAFAELSPDYVVVLGDRYELLSIVSTAFIMGIPVIHLSGGDITEGAIDDGIRNAVTMMAEYHFPGTEDSAENIKRMRGSDKNVWAVGEPGLDSFFREQLYDREELSRELGLDINSRWVLFTYHPETKRNQEYNMAVVRDCISLLTEMDGLQVVATYSNADYGGKAINEYLEKEARNNTGKLKVVPSLGNRRYLSFMRQTAFVVGNSSTGIVEAPTLGVPVVNIGDRQKGRHQCDNVVQCNGDRGSIISAIDKAMNMDTCTPDNYWGDGKTAKRIMKILRTIN